MHLTLAKRRLTFSQGLTKYNLDSFQNDLYWLVQAKIKKCFYNTNNVICKVKQNWDRQTKYRQRN